MHTTPTSLHLGLSKIDLFATCPSAVIRGSQGNLLTLMHDWHTVFLVLVFRDPQLVEGTQRGKHRTAEPGRVFALEWNGGRVNLDFLLHGQLSVLSIHLCEFKLVNDGLSSALGGPVPRF